MGLDNYLTTEKYAKLHGKTDARIRQLCIDNKFPLSEKKGGVWFIHKNSPYPELKKRGRKAKVKTQ